MKDSCGSSTTISTGILSDHPTLTARHLPLGLLAGFLAPGFFGVTFKALSAANG
jgi:hypothetical protein